MKAAFNLLLVVALLGGSILASPQMKVVSKSRLDSSLKKLSTTHKQSTAQYDCWGDVNQRMADLDELLQSSQPLHQEYADLFKEERGWLQENCKGIEPPVVDPPAEESGYTCWSEDARERLYDLDMLIESEVPLHVEFRKLFEEERAWVEANCPRTGGIKPSKPLYPVDPLPINRGSYTCWGNTKVRIFELTDLIASKHKLHNEFEFLFIEELVFLLKNCKRPILCKRKYPSPSVLSGKVPKRISSKPDQKEESSKKSSGSK